MADVLKFKSDRGGFNPIPGYEPEPESTEGQNVPQSTDPGSRHREIARNLTRLLLIKFANDKASGVIRSREHAKKLAGSIRAALKAYVPEGKDIPEEFAVDQAAVERIVGGTFWDGSKLYMVNPEEQGLVFCSVTDAKTFIKRSHGYPVDIKAAGRALAAFLPIDSKSKCDPAEAAIKVATSIVHKLIMDHVKYHNQRSKIEYRVDMFADTARIELRENTARVVLVHKPLVADGRVDEEIIKDYRQHFPEIDNLLALIVAARFADDRKKAFLWLLALSDWGKGLLIGALKELGIVVEMSVKEIEAIFEGKPVGRSPTDFTRAFILLVDEFKAVKSELKQLQSGIQLSPKFQMMCEVEVYLKMFTSAEEVGSLVGSNGVEDQFANRFSLINKLEAETIVDRPAFQEAGGRYKRALAAFAAREMNRMISEYQALGREDAEKRGRDFLDAFIAKHGIALTYGRISDSMEDLAAQFAAWLKAKDAETVDPARKVVSLERYGGATYLLGARAAFDRFVSERFDHSERATISKKVSAVLKSISEDGKGSASHRIPEPTRSVKIRREFL